MARDQRDNSHRAAVDAWLALAVDLGSSAEVVHTFDQAFELVWNHVGAALGTVTLSAIAERVLHDAVARYPFLSAINPRPNGDARWRDTLRVRLAMVPRTDLLAGLRFGLIELLTVIGSLTAEILSDDLHAALAESAATARTAARAPSPEVLS